MSAFIDVTDQWNINDGGQRHVRTIDEDCWISVLHRMTGFGCMEWETAICFRGVKRSPFLVRGDWRSELETMPREELMTWYESKNHDNMISFDAVMGRIRESMEVPE